MKSENTKPAIKLSKPLPLAWKEFQAYLFGAWSCSVAEAGKSLVATWKNHTWTDPETRRKASRTYQKERERLVAICSEAPVPGSGAGAADRAAYDAKAYSLWLSSAARRRLLNLADDPARLFFHEKKEFASHLREFFESLPNEATTLNLTDIFDVDREQLRSWSTSTDLPFRGRISLTAGTAGTTIKIESKDLQPRPNQPRIYNLPSDEIAQWWSQRPDPSSLAKLVSEAPDAFASLAQDLCEAIETRSGGLPLPPAVSEKPATDEEFEIIHIFGGVGELDLGWLAERHHRQLQQENKPVLLVLFTTSPFGAAQAALLQALPTSERRAIVICLIATPTEMEGYLTQAPWIWSKHFAKDMDFSVVDVRDRDAVQRALLRSPLLDAVPFNADLSMFDGLAKSAGTAELTEIVGRPGAGKSCAIAASLLSRASGIAIVLRTGVHTDTFDILPGICKAIDKTRRPVVMVVEDVHTELYGWPVRSTLARVLALRGYFTQRPQIIISYWSSEAPEFRRQFGGTLAGYDPKVLDIDHPPLSFWHRLLAYIVATLRVATEPDALMACASDLHDRGATPLDVVAAIFARTKVPTDSFSIPVASGMCDYWWHRYRQLEHDDPGAADLMKVLAFLRLGSEPLTVVLVSALFSLAFQRDESSVQGVLRRLQDDLWVKIYDRRIFADNVLLRAVQRAFYDVEGNPTVEVRQIAAAAGEFTSSTMSHDSLYRGLQVSRQGLHLAMFVVASAAGDRSLLRSAAQLLDPMQPDAEVWLNAALNAIDWGRIAAAAQWIKDAAIGPCSLDMQEVHLYMGLCCLIGRNDIDAVLQLTALVIREYESALVAKVAIRIVGDLALKKHLTLARDLAAYTVRERATHTPALLDVMERAPTLSSAGGWPEFNRAFISQSLISIPYWRQAFLLLGSDAAQIEQLDAIERKLR